MKYVVTAMLAAALAAVSGCATNLDERRAENVEYVNAYLDRQVEDGIIRQRTVYPYHSIHDSPELNDHGKRDLTILAKHYADHAMPHLGIREIHKNVKVYFDYNRSEIRSDAAPVLDDAVQSLKDHADSQILVTGHADVRGSNAYNERLGARRADAVRDYLIGKGVADERIEILSRGEIDALAPVSDQEGMQEDRNAHFLVADVEEVYPLYLNVRQGQASDQLYKARVNRIVAFLEEQGVDSRLITITDSPSGGDGMDSERVLKVLTAMDDDDDSQSVSLFAQPSDNE